MTVSYTPAQLAEQAGGMVGHRLLNALTRAANQGEALTLLDDALADVADHPASLRGFAVQLIDVLLIGLRNLPRASQEVQE